MGHNNRTWEIYYRMIVRVRNEVKKMGTALQKDIHHPCTMDDEKFVLHNMGIYLHK